MNPMFVCLYAVSMQSFARMQIDARARERIHSILLKRIIPQADIITSVSSNVSNLMLSDQRLKIIKLSFRACLSVCMTGIYTDEI